MYVYAYSVYVFVAEYICVRDRGYMYGYILYGYVYVFVRLYVCEWDIYI